MASVKTHTVLLESVRILCSSVTGICHYPLVKSILDTESSEQVFSRGHRFWIYFGYLIRLPKLITHPVRTIFFLNMTSTVSRLPSTAYCQLHSVSLPTWHTAGGKAYIVSVCLLPASLKLNHIGFSGHICKHIRVTQVLQCTSLVFR